MSDADNFVFTTSDYYELQSLHHESTKRIPKKFGDPDPELVYVYGFFMFFFILLNLFHQCIIRRLKQNKD
jgi:hypothetical protein